MPATGGPARTSPIATKRARREPGSAIHRWRTRRRRGPRSRSSRCQPSLCRRGRGDGSRSWWACSAGQSGQFRPARKIIYNSTHRGPSREPNSVTSNPRLYALHSRPLGNRRRAATARPAREEHRFFIAHHSARRRSSSSCSGSSADPGGARSRAFVRAASGDARSALLGLVVMIRSRPSPSGREAGGCDDVAGRPAARRARWHRAGWAYLRLPAGRTFATFLALNRHRPALFLGRRT
jgi:hypothetical protein